MNADVASKRNPGGRVFLHGVTAACYGRSLTGVSLLSCCRCNPAGVSHRFTVKLLAQVGLRISATDPLAYATIVPILVAIGAFACWLLARRAALDPVRAIHDE